MNTASRSSNPWLLLAAGCVIAVSLAALASWPGSRAVRSAAPGLRSAPAEAGDAGLALACVALDAGAPATGSQRARLDSTPAASAANFAWPRPTRVLDPDTYNPLDRSLRDAMLAGLPILEIVERAGVANAHLALAAQQALLQLGARGERELQHVLANSATDRDRQTALEGIAILGRVRREPAWARFRDALAAAALHDAHEGLRARALELLAGSQPAVVISALQDPHWAVRLAALRSISRGAEPGPELRRCVELLRDDPSPPVSATASRWLAAAPDRLNSSAASKRAEVADRGAPERP